MQHFDTITVTEDMAHTLQRLIDLVFAALSDDMPYQRRMSVALNIIATLVERSR